MIEFPNLQNCDVFPLPEGTNLELKLGFNSAMPEKYIATVCGILNAGGGYIVIGVEDETRRIVGIEPDKKMDKFILMIDNIYHHENIRKNDGQALSIGTIKSGTVETANNKLVCVVTITPEPNTIYSVRDGIIWHRLGASNFKQTGLINGYTKQEHDMILEKRLKHQEILLTKKFNIELQAVVRRYQSENDKLKSKFTNLEKDFKAILGSSKEFEESMNQFRDSLYKTILEQKAEAEQTLEANNKSWWQRICCL